MGPGRHAHAASERALVQLEGALAGRNLDPEEEAAARARDARARRKVERDRFGHARHLVRQRAPQAAQVAFVAAVLQELGDGHLRDRGARHRVRKLQALDDVAIAAGRDVAHAEARRERLRERAAQHDGALPVESAGGPGAGTIEVQVPVDVVLDERDVVAPEDAHELALRLVWHEGAERVREVRHEHARLHGLVPERLVEQRDIDARAGDRRDLERPHPERLDELQDAVVRGALDGDRVTPPGPRRAGRCAAPPSYRPWSRSRRPRAARRSRPRGARSGGAARAGPGGGS